MPTPIGLRVSLEDLLRRNRAWAAAQVAADPAFFTRLVVGQQPRLLWIGCSDSRVPAEQILDCGPGELFIHRNVANIVAYNDINIAAVIEYATKHLKIPDVVICGHYGCGGHGGRVRRQDPARLHRRLAPHRRTGPARSGHAAGGGGAKRCPPKSSCAGS